jgi:hypothetical protein
MATVVFHFVIAALAIWRITHLLSKEDGPFDLVFKLRKQLGQGFFGNLLDCFYCLSMWVAIPFGIWVGTTVIEKIVCCIALSGLSCIIEIMTEKKAEPPQYSED